MATTTTLSTLPGEAGPITDHPGPITDDAALGVARRLARLRGTEPPAQLTTAKVMSACRLPPALLDAARQRATELGVSVTSIVDAGLRAAADNTPVSTPLWADDADDHRDRVLAAWRIAGDTLARARARAEVRQTTVTALIETALRGWLTTTTAAVVDQGAEAVA